MVLNEHSSRQFICENLKNMKCFGKSFFDRNFLKAATLPNAIPQPPKFSGYQPSKVLSFLSELSNDHSINQETKFNLLLAELFDVEYAFFIHRQNKKNCFLLRAIGAKKLTNKLKFTLSMESMSGSNHDIAKAIVNKSAFRNAILDLIQQPIKNMKVMNVCPEENIMQYPFLLIFINKYVSLGKNDPKTIVGNGSYQPKRISAEISLEDSTIIRDMMRLLSPILNTLLYKDASALLKWLPETAKRMTLRFNELSAWVKYVSSLSKRLLNEDRVRIYLIEDIKKFIMENPTAIEETSEFNENKKDKILTNYVTIEQVCKRKNGTLPDKLSSKNISMGDSTSVIKGTLCIPILAAAEVLGVFKILRKEDYISFENMEKAQAIAILCTFGIMFWQLQQLKKNS